MLESIEAGMADLYVEHNDPSHSYQTHDLSQTSRLTRILLTYRQFIFITVYSHLLCSYSAPFAILASITDPLSKYSIIRCKFGGAGQTYSSLWLFGLWSC